MADLEQLINRVRARQILMHPNLARELRTAAGLTQQEVGDLIGVSNVAVSYWETGSRVPNKEIADRYLNILIAAVDPNGTQNLLAQLQRLVPRDPWNLLGSREARDKGEEVNGQVKSTKPAGSNPYGLNE